MTKKKDDDDIDIGKIRFNPKEPITIRINCSVCSLGKWVEVAPREEPDLLMKKLFCRNCNKLTTHIRKEKIYQEKSETESD